MLKKELQTLNEMIEQNITLYAAASMRGNYNMTELYKELTIVNISDGERQHFMDKIMNDSSFPGAVNVNMFDIKTML